MDISTALIPIVLLLSLAMVVYAFVVYNKNDKNDEDEEDDL